AATLYRCALVRASAASLAYNVPQPLFVGLVESEVWSPAVALAYATPLRERALAAIAHLLPEQQVPVALGHLDGPGTYYLRPVAVTRLLRRRIDQGCAHEVLPFLARQIPEYRARSLVELAPHLPEELRPTAWAEVRACVEQLGEHPINLRTTLLMQLAAQLPHEQRPAVLSRAMELVHEDCGLDTKHLMLLGRAGDLEQALRLAENQTYPYTRSLYFAHVLAGARGVEETTRAFHAWECAERAVWAEDSTVLRTVWPLPLPPQLVDAFLALAREVPFPKARAQTLTQLALIHHVGAREALDAVHALDGSERVFGLLSLAPALEGPERAAALSAVLAAVRAHRWGVPDEAWDWADRHWQLPEDGEIEWTQNQMRTAAELLATAARLLPAEERVPVLHEALAASRVIGDDAERSLALTALADRLAGTARTDVLTAALAAARAAAAPKRRAQALVVLAPVFSAAAREAIAAIAFDSDSMTEVVRVVVAAAEVLPVAEQHAALEALLDARARRRGDDRHGWALGLLVPHLPAELLERALRDAERDIEVLLVAGLGAWPAHRRPAAESAARSVLEACLRDRFVPPEEWLPDVAPRISEPLLREAIAIAARPSDRPFAPAPEQLLETLLPCLAQRGAGAEAVEHARAVASEHHRNRLLGLLLPHLAPSLRDAITAELARAHALPRGPLPGDEQRWAANLLEAVREVVSHGRDPAVAATSRTFGSSDILHDLLKLAGKVSDHPVRGELLAVAIDRALSLVNDHLPGLLPGFCAHAAELERRPFVALFARALKAAARYGRVRFLVEEDKERPRHIARALEALGGEAAVLGAARAFIEVGRWFP
ncbi:MAG TPA: hypothetical protein VN253_07840, partial [Kofleriaceae bacterium]|nr:hypothetical protein [Kofleriaceae bacterium]